MKFNADAIVSFFKGNKKRAILLALIAIGTLLLIISASSEGKDGSTSDRFALNEYKEELEEELSSLCSTVRGVGRCSVFVTFSEGARAEYKGANQIASRPPVVCGISIVCDGGNNDAVCDSITQMMCALFDIGANRISVLAKK